MSAVQDQRRSVRRLVTSRVQPARVRRRFRGALHSVRLVLSHPDTHRLLAVAAAAGETAPPSSTVGPEHVTIRLSHGERPTDLVLWTADPHDPGIWRATRRDLLRAGTNGAADQGVGERTGGAGPRPVALGAETDDPSCVSFIDLAQSPGIVQLSGPPEAARELLGALAVQLAMQGDPADRTVFLAGDVIPGLAPLTLERAMADLSRTAPSPETGQGPVLVWFAGPAADPREDQRDDLRRQLTRLLAERPDVVVMTTARWGGAFWRLRVGSDGRVTCPELGVESWTDCLAPALAVVAQGRLPRNPAGSPG